MFNFLKKNDEIPEIDIVTEQKKNNRNLVITFSVLAFIFFNIVMYLLTRV